MNTKINHKIVSIFFYVLVLPQIFLMISSIAFYIHAGVFSGYSSISGISPKEPLFYEIYPNIINLSSMISFYTFFIWCVFGILFWFLNKNENIKASIVFGAIIQILILFLVISPLFEFVGD